MVLPLNTRTLEKLGSFSSILAGAVHGVVAPAHLEEWWGYGLFFLAAAAFQVLFGVALLTRAINPKDFGAGFERARNVLLIAGVVANVAILAMWVITRTTGIPWFGSQAGEVEAVGVLDTIAAVAEVGTVVVVAMLLKRSSHANATTLAD